MFKAQTHLSDTISREAEAIHKPENAIISGHYVSKRLEDLENLSCYLVEGEGAWWKSTDQGETIEFLDVTMDGEPHGNPQIKHYRTSGLMELRSAKLTEWERIVQLDITLPTPRIKLYNAAGNFLSYKVFPKFAKIDNYSATCTTTVLHQWNV